MARHIENEVANNDDFRSTEEEVKSGAAFRIVLIHYLVDVLTWLLRDQDCTIYENLNFYQTARFREYLLDPDIAVMNVDNFQPGRGWHDSINGPTLQIVIELISEENWQKDLEEKLGTYAQMGVQEYFAYDYHDPPLLERRASRWLFGWQLDHDKRTLTEIPAGADGQLWSSHLACFLVPDQTYLRIYDSYGQRCLTKAEYETQRSEAKVASEGVETQRAEARSAGTFAESLRALGIDPDL